MFWVFHLLFLASGLGRLVIFIFSFDCRDGGCRVMNLVKCWSLITFLGLLPVASADRCAWFTGKHHMVSLGIYSFFLVVRISELYGTSQAPNKVREECRALIMQSSGVY